MGSDENQKENTRSFLQPGLDAHIGRYHVINRIAAGGMGEVFLAEDVELSRTVALKFLPSHLCEDADCRARFRREAQAAARLSHPNIVTIFEIGEFDNRPYIAMEHLRGKSLREIIKSKKPALTEAIDIAVQVCQGLKAAHAGGIIHRDIKPANILHDGAGTYKLVDFGLASVVGSDRLTQGGGVMGTVGYMSPEQVRGEEVDATSDIFSLGVVLYELLAGQQPFRRETEAATLHAILNENPPPMRELCPELPPELAMAVERSLARERAERYADIDSYLADLSAVHARLGEKSSRARRSERQPSVAVLPFANFSADREQDYFCDGIAEEIINALSHVAGLRVVARTSSFSFRGRDLDIREIGRRLNVDTLLEGSVRKAGDRLRVIAQLTNVGDGYHLWSERFDRQMADVFAIQDEISLNIVDRLKVRLLADERRQITKRHTENREAYHLYLKGRYFWGRRHEGGLQKGIEAFEEAARLDPEYASAYIGIADCYNQLALWGYVEPNLAYGRAKAAAQKALAIDPLQAEVHASLGWIKLWHDWDWAGSEREFQRALKLNPHYDMAHEWYALYLAVMLRPEDGLVEAARVIELDPLSLVGNSIVGLGAYWSRRFDDAVALLNKTVELDPSFPYTYLFLCWTYAGKKAWPEAIAAGEKFSMLTSGSAVSLGYLGAVCALGGHSERAYEALEQLEFLARERFVSSLYRAVVHMGLGHINEALEHLERARLERESFLPVIYSFPLFDSIRDDMRFVELLGRMGLHYE